MRTSDGLGGDKRKLYYHAVDATLAVPSVEATVEGTTWKASSFRPGRYYALARDPASADRRDHWRRGAIAAGWQVDFLLIEDERSCRVVKVWKSGVDVRKLPAPVAIAPMLGNSVKAAIPEASAAVNAYPITTVADSAAGDLAAEFVDLVLSEDGQAVLRAAGFGAP